jgi:hypothetical protein
MSNDLRQKADQPRHERAGRSMKRDHDTTSSLAGSGPAVAHVAPRWTAKFLEEQKVCL